jgi:hypothetical protein
MEEIDVSKIINALKDNNCEYITELLKRTNSILVGGFVIDSYCDNYKEIDTTVHELTEILDSETLDEYKYIKSTKKINLDIYAHPDNMIEILNELINIHQFGITDIKIHYPYIAYADNRDINTFLLTDDALLRVMLFNIDNGISIDVTIIKKTIELVTSIRNSDLTFSRIWYDGNKTYSLSSNEIKDMKGSLNTDFYYHYCNDNLYLLNKIQKYRYKGFNISLPHCKNVNKTDFKSNIESFILKYLLNQFLLSMKNKGSNQIYNFFLNMIYEANIEENIPLSICIFLTSFNHYKFMEIEQFIKKYNLKKYMKLFIELLENYKNNCATDYKGLNGIIKEEEYALEYYKKIKNHEEMQSGYLSLKKMKNRKEHLYYIIKCIEKYIKIKKNTTKKLFNIVTKKYTSKKMGTTF